METRNLRFVLALGAILDLVYCACDVKLSVKSNTEMELTSPNYPSNFSHNQHCFYDLVTEMTSGDVLHLFVLDVTLSCHDKNTSLEVFDAFSTSARSLGKVCSGGPTKFVSPKEKLYLVFKSGGDGEATSRGFKVNVVSVPEFGHCYSQQAKVLSVLPESQHIVSPYYPSEVAPNVHCRWLLKAPLGYRVHLDILSADMKGSNDCFNFGLYIFDGKTTYDDEKLGTVCSKNIRSFYSSSNYLMVVFSSGPHVLLSGGGIELAYYSSLADSNAVEKDSSLLFIIIGVLLGIASFTIIMIILRFFVIPARKKSLARRYTPSHRNSSITSSSLPAVSIPSEPPPPYHVTETGRHRGSRKWLWISTCGWCFPRDKSHRQRSSQTNTMHFSNDFVFAQETEDPVSNNEASPHGVFAITDNYFNRGLYRVTPRGDTRHIVGNVNSGEIITRTQCNEYQELPPLENIGQRFSEDLNTQYFSIDSGYQTVAVGEENHDIDTLSPEDLDIHDALSCLDNATVYENASINSSDLARVETKDGNCSDSSGDITSNKNHNKVDEGGYEIPLAVHRSDRPVESRTEENEDGEGVYHNPRD